MGLCQSQESFGFEILGSSALWKLTPFDVRDDPAALSSVWPGGHSEFLVVMTGMITNEAGFFLEQNMVVWGPLFGK